MKPHVPLYQIQLHGERRLMDGLTTQASAVGGTGVSIHGYMLQNKLLGRGRKLLPTVLCFLSPVTHAAYLTSRRHVCSLGRFRQQPPNRQISGDGQMSVAADLPPFY